MAGCGRFAVRLLAAALSGAVLAATLPPLDLLPALAAYSALVILAEAEDGARRPLVRRALVGAAFGFGYHLAGLWWIGAAFLVDADTFGALLPFAVVGLPLLLAPFHAAAVALAGLAPPGRVARTIGLAGALSFTEWLRGFAFTGFPWNVPAVQLSASPALVQAVAVVGVAGLAPLAVLLGATPALLARFPLGRDHPSDEKSRQIGTLAQILIAPIEPIGAEYPLATRRFVAAGAILVVGVAVWAAGAARLAGAPQEVAGPRVRIVQPAIPQREKWDAAQRRRIWQTLLDLTERPAADGSRPPVIVWPETAFPFLYRTGTAEQADVAAALAPDGTLVTGVIETNDVGAERRFTNSIIVVNRDGVPVERYDKAHLVPFGEYLPFAGLLRRIGLTALVETTGAFTAGTQGAQIEFSGRPPARALICYEVVFRQAGLVPAAEWIINVTNDAWFGDTPGPHQHLRHAILRAIEEGVPIVRAANTGISALIDPYGRTQFRLPLNQRDVLDVTVPPDLDVTYRWSGNTPLYITWVVLLLWVVLSWMKRPLRRV